ncbi:MAG: hypothetical protein ACREI8_09260, partial [Myxococcota bacterium]
MARVVALALVLLLAPAAHAVLTPAERGELADALDALSQGAGGQAARALELLRRPDTSAPELERFFADWYAERASTEPLARWVGVAAFHEPLPEARARVQQ